MLKKIVIIGPESTGKSTLCEKLAAHYNTSWVKEYAREYLHANGTDYTFDNLLDIAKGQIAGEEVAISNRQAAMGNEQQAMSNKQKAIDNSEQAMGNEPSTMNYQPLFIDTDMYVMKVWCEFVFDRCHNWILDQITERKYDLYLLCNVDLPWVKDELREYPDLESREKLYHFYKELMVNQQTPWVDISGNYEERVLKAIKAVDEILV